MLGTPTVENNGDPSPEVEVQEPQVDEQGDVRLNEVPNEENIAFTPEPTKTNVIKPDDTMNQAEIPLVDDSAAAPLVLAKEDIEILRPNKAVSFPENETLTSPKG